MNRFTHPRSVCLLAVLGACLSTACSNSSGPATGTGSSGNGSTSGSPGGSGSGASGSASGGTGSGALPGSGSAGSSNGSGSAGSGSGGGSGAAAVPEAGGGSGFGSGSSGSSSGGSSGASAGSSGSSVPDGGPGPASGGDASAGTGSCNLPATVSFQKDVQPFLMTSCGGGGAVNAGSGGCHVIDAASTMAAGGFDHAYDWLTGTAHSSSCPGSPTPERFQVVIPVIQQANPPSCSHSRRMPPPDATGANLRPPLTTCQIATLQAWLNEPLVTQMHRADGISPTTPYPMPPFN